MEKFQEGKKYVFVAKKVKRRCNSQQWKFAKIWANCINGQEVEGLINDYQGFIGEFIVTASWCKEMK